ncbi:MULTISPECIES: alpha/beta hydrolase [Aminobacter]|jgi:phospholipase/carboxylesterase|uniref:Phospholipase/carboxylesterase n=1 Tax=Aminobacter ciceronei TaxID=150723 RepID=A0ABR6CHS0_9HYPH|nr:MULTISPECIES: dienelactone hydrolase family protein [Aminobacter]MBA8910834.1 phospholipase/carboxylesterase [Aminobacter ciceronei]MBA9024607.1 phospholipase/carboxylesterase [Aminobacter ciceronei]MRX37464.1 phospholipase [Aminobacter sp. MDW-2]QNH35565.1 dienelactone hydrolase family protein [Aminobacter sp. MDW-2]
MNNSHAKSLVVFLHGVGSRGADLMPLAQAWQPSLPTAAFAAPDGPFAFDAGGADRQWFSISAVTEANRPQRIAAARPAFDDTLRGTIEQHGLLNHLDRVVLVGFSQGSIMALDAIVSGRWPVGAVVAYSGRLASPRPFMQTGSPRVLAVHGAADPVIPAGASIEAMAALRELGLDANSHILPGVGHTITTEGAQLGAAFLAAALKSEAK